MSGDANNLPLRERLLAANSVGGLSTHGLIRKQGRGWRVAIYPSVKILQPLLHINRPTRLKSRATGVYCR
jgi:hypothetical protein